MAEMTKGERTELRQAVRLQFKVLRSEVLQREAEVTDSILDEVEEEFHERSELEAKVLREFATLVDGANASARAILTKNGLLLRDEARPMIEITRMPIFAQQEMVSRERRVRASLQVKVKEALAQLDRQEAQMLQQLTLDAIEGDAARKFFEAIPVVSALVPMVRLAELEASFEDRSRG